MQLFSLIRWVISRRLSGNDVGGTGERESSAMSWVWSKSNHKGTAGFSPCFHLPGFQFGHLFLTHSLFLGELFSVLLGQFSGKQMALFEIWFPSPSAIYLSRHLGVGSFDVSTVSGSVSKKLESRVRVIMLEGLCRPEIKTPSFGCQEGLLFLPTQND